MFQTIALSSRVSAQGEIVEVLGNGEVVIRDGRTFYRGRPISRDRLAPGLQAAAVTALRPVAPSLPDGDGAA